MGRPKKTVQIEVNRQFLNWCSTNGLMVKKNQEVFFVNERLLMKPEYIINDSIIRDTVPCDPITKTYYKTKDYCKVKFSFKPELAETVEILGLNSDWQNAIIMSKKKDGSFNAEVNLPKDSKHEFKYRIDSTMWVNDPEADSEVPNSFGGSNSLVVI